MSLGWRLGSMEEEEGRGGGDFIVRRWLIWMDLWAVEGDEGYIIIFHSIYI